MKNKQHLDRESALDYSWVCKSYVSSQSFITSSQKWCVLKKKVLCLPGLETGKSNVKVLVDSAMMRCPVQTLVSA